MSRSKRPRDVNDNIKPEDKQKHRLDQLLAQIEKFTECVTRPQKGITEKPPSKNSKSKSRQPKNKHNDNHDRYTFKETPHFIRGEMRDYQIDGLNWMLSLFENNINGILADEMGLGKTLQTISVLSCIKDQGFGGPFLVIAPKSTISNWMNEIRRFSKNLFAIAFIGEKTQRKKLKTTMLDDRVQWDVCVTTYEMVVIETYFMKKFDWQYIVVDEGHRMKNESNKFSEIMRTFKSQNRLLLTGTPLQNDLHELWALLNYLMPHMFRSSSDFDAWFDSDDCLSGNDSAVKRLQLVLAPLMLRRIKAEVEKSLLPKLEVKLFVGMTALQREVYCKVLRKEVMQTNMMGEKSLKRIDMIWMELRKAANHPYLIDNIEPEPFTTDESLVNCCGKMMLLDKLLAKLKEQGSRVLIFTQFVIMLNILDDYLNWRGYNYRRLDGQTSYEDRAIDIDAFNAPNSDIFAYLISTKAGGLGINLATADTVIIYDSDWNPQNDAQAVDRVYRIGQKKQVRIFRLISENTIDERVVQRAEIKLRLDQMVIKSGRSVKNDGAERPDKKRMIEIVRFDADRMLSDGVNDIIDIDLEQIIKEGTIKTNVENEKYAKMKEEELRNFTLQEASSSSIYNFEGIDYRQITKAPVEISPAVRTARLQSQVELKPSAPVKLVTLHEYQLFPSALYLLCVPGTFKIDMGTQTELKQPMFDEGFPKWDKRDFNTFCEAIIKYGPNDLGKVAEEMPHKSAEEVIRYAKAFLTRGRVDLPMFPQIKARMKAQQKARAAKQAKIDAFNWKCAQYSDPAKQLAVYSSSDREDNNILLRALYTIGFDTSKVHQKIRDYLQVSTDPVISAKLRELSVDNISKRIKNMLDIIENEYAKQMAGPDTSPQKTDTSSLEATSSGEKDDSSPAKRSENKGTPNKSPISRKSSPLKNATNGGKGMLSGSEATNSQEKSKGLSVNKSIFDTPPIKMENGTTSLASLNGTENERQHDEANTSPKSTFNGNGNGLNDATALPKQKSPTKKVATSNQATADANIDPTPNLSTSESTKKNSKKARVDKTSNGTNSIGSEDAMHSEHPISPKKASKAGPLSSKSKQKTGARSDMNKSGSSEKQNDNGIEPHVSQTMNANHPSKMKTNGVNEMKSIQATDSDQIEREANKSNDYLASNVVSPKKTKKAKIGPLSKIKQEMAKDDAPHKASNKRKATPASDLNASHSNDEPNGGDMKSSSSNKTVESTSSTKRRKK